MGDLEVDLDGLDAFAARLHRICAALDDAKDVLRGDDDAIGDGDVVDALDRFEDRWRDGRKTIDENASTLATMVEESVRTYRQTDDDLRDALLEAKRDTTTTRRSTA